MNKNKKVNLCLDMLVDIFKYLTIQEVFRTGYLNREINHLINYGNSIIFEHLDLAISEEVSNISCILKIVNNNDIKVLDLLLCENINYVKDILGNLSKVEYLKVLKVPLIAFSKIKNLSGFSKLEELTVKNMYFNEAGLFENKLMIECLLKLKKIKKLKLNGIKFSKCDFLNCLNLNIGYLDIRESVEFIIEDIIPFINYNAASLRVLKIDGENTNEKFLIKCLKVLNNLTYLSISYCENFSDFFILELTSICFKLTKISLRKLKKISCEALESFFLLKDFSKFIKIDFYDCQNFNNNCLLNMSNTISNLEELDISWSNEIQNDSLEIVLKKCLKSRKLILQGNKRLNENLFNNFLNINIKSAFHSLSLLDLTKCDAISDKLIKTFINLYSCLDIINYYGMSIKHDRYY